MSVGLKVLAALLVIAGSGFLVCGVGWCVAARRDRAVDAAEGSESCCGPAADGYDHDPWCRTQARVVASDDLDPLEALWRMPAYDGERAS